MSDELKKLKSEWCKKNCHPGAACPDGFCKEVNDMFDPGPMETKGCGPVTTTAGTPFTVESTKLYGWICPVCGRGLSPFTSVCPCRNDGKGWEITCQI